MDRGVFRDGRPEHWDRDDEPSPQSVDGARAELVAYFAAIGDESGRARELSETLVARAAQRWRVRRERDLAEIALEEAESELAAWGAFVLGQERIGEHSAVLMAQAAYRGCGGAAHWPDMLLNYDLPAAFVQAMRSSAPVPTPPERPGRMVVQPLETWSIVEAVSPRVWNRLIGALAGSSRA